jgi:DeoR family transcriptional regulator, aga operon transcriptional repressor
MAQHAMLNVERRTKILELLEKQGQITVGGLSKRFKTSEVTIRNDLKALHDRGLIRRAHGGAVKIATVSMDPSLKIKSELHADEKRRIGAAAAQMINDGDSVILDSGTTTHQIARQIKHKKDLKIITNGLNIAMELFGASNIQLIFLGGVIRQNSLSAVGHFAEDILAQLSADKVFLAVDACDLEFGLSTPNVEESQVNQAMARIAKEKILVADSSKFGKRSLSRIIPLSEVDVIITDRALPQDIQNELRARELRLMLV